MNKLKIYLLVFYYENLEVIKKFSIRDLNVYKLIIWIIYYFLRVYVNFWRKKRFFIENILGEFFYCLGFVNYDF